MESKLKPSEYIELTIWRQREQGFYLCGTVLEIILTAAENRDTK